MALSDRLDLIALSEIDGYIAGAIVDSDSGMSLATDGGGSALDINVAAAGITDVVKKKRSIVNKLELDDEIDDILISLEYQYHLIRPLRSDSRIFVYLVLDRERANLGMARMDLNQFEKQLDLG